MNFKVGETILIENKGVLHNTKAVILEVFEQHLRVQAVDRITSLHMVFCRKLTKLEKVL